MPLIDSEVSTYGGRPVELYEFSADGQFYRLTGYPVPYVFGGNTYLPSPQLKRQNIVRASIADKPPELVIDIAEAEDLIQDNCYDRVPFDFSVRIHRVQPNGSHTWWDGEVSGFAVKGDRAEIRCPSILDDMFKNEVPGVHFTAQCQHFLYDQHCRVDPLAFDQAAVADTVSGVTIEVSTVGGNPDGYYQGGTVLTLSGHRRLIVRQVGTTLTLFYPFFSGQIAAAEAVTLFAGCDRKIETCVAKFNNKQHFGGYPIVPLKNLFRRPFRGL